MAKDVYKFREVEEYSEFFEDFGFVDKDLPWNELLNAYNNMISMGCHAESISLNIRVTDNYDSPQTYLTWRGTRRETDYEYQTRIEAYERRSAAAKGAVSKRKEREIAKARKEITEAQETIQKLTEKFGISILTD